MAMHTIKTEVSVVELSNFKIFLEANDITDVVIGIYQKRVNNYQLDNYIEYSYSDKEDGATTGLMYMELKYGGIENAFNDFLRKTNRIRNGGFIG